MSTDICLDNPHTLYADKREFYCPQTGFIWWVSGKHCQNCGEFIVHRADAPEDTNTIEQTITALARAGEREEAERIRFATTQRCIECGGKGQSVPGITCTWCDGSERIETREARQIRLQREGKIHDHALVNPNGSIVTITAPGSAADCDRCKAATAESLTTRVKQAVLDTFVDTCHCDDPFCRNLFAQAVVDKLKELE